MQQHRRYVDWKDRFASGELAQTLSYVHSFGSTGSTRKALQDAPPDDFFIHLIWLLARVQWPTYTGSCTTITLVVLGDKHPVVDLNCSSMVEKTCLNMHRSFVVKTI